MSATKTDRYGNDILTAGCQDYIVFDIEGVTSVIDKSETTESVYVTYRANGKSVTVRFSNHMNNAVLFGDQLNGNTATVNEILFRLGMKQRIFKPDTFLFIIKRAVAKKDLANYEVAHLTIQEMYNLGKDADLSEFKGKVAKDSNYLIQGDKVEEAEKTSRNIFGDSVTLGRYIYF